VSNPEEIIRNSGSAVLAVALGITSMLLISVAAWADQPPGVYTVKDGNKVDDKTLQGWKTWRAMACERCHGAAQEGLVGPSLMTSLARPTRLRRRKTGTSPSRVCAALGFISVMPMSDANTLRLSGARVVFTFLGS